MANTEKENLDWLVKTGQVKDPAPTKVATTTEKEEK